MLTPDSLQSRFGEWVVPFVSAVEPLLSHFRDTKCFVSFAQSSKSNQAIFTVKLRTDQFKGAWLESKTLLQFQMSSIPFKRQCLDVRCEMSFRDKAWWVKMEFELADPTELTVAQLNGLQQRAAWQPDAQLTSALAQTCSEQFGTLSKECSQLDASSVVRVQQLLQLYCTSSHKTLPPKVVFVPAQLELLVLSNVKCTSWNWWVYLLEQKQLGVSSIAMHENEMYIYLNPPLQLKEESIQTCVQRRRPSLFRTIKNRMWPFR